MNRKGARAPRDAAQHPAASPDARRKRRRAALLLAAVLGLGGVAWGWKIWGGDDPTPVTGPPVGVDRLRYFPPVGDQGLTTTCVSWAVSSLAAYHQAVDRREEEEEEDGQPSVTWLHYLAIWHQALQKKSDPVGDSPASVQPQDVVDLLQSQPKGYRHGVQAVVSTLERYGAPRQSTTGYSDSEWPLPLPLPAAAWREEAAAPANNWFPALKSLARLTPQELPMDRAAETLRAALGPGPALLLLKPPLEFFDLGGGAVHPATTDSGSHAVVVVCYEHAHPFGSGNVQPAVLLLNSWGTCWGEQGLAWVSCEDLHTKFRPVHVWALGTETLQGAVRPATPPTLFLRTEAADNDKWTCSTTACAVPGSTGQTRGGSTHRARPGASSQGPRASRADVVPLTCRRQRGATLTLRSPAIPLVPAMVGARLSYAIHGKPVGPGESHLGVRVLFAERADHPGEGNSGVGVDADAVGAWIQRAVFEVVNPDHPDLSHPLEVRVQVRDEWDDSDGPARFERTFKVTFSPP